MPYPAEPSLIRIRAQVSRMRAVIQSPALLYCADRVSAWSPAEHIDHSIKVSLSVVKRLTNREPLGGSISFLGRAVLFLDWIPRGRGKAPAKLYGARETPLVLETALAKLENALTTVSPSDIDAVRIPVIPHPRFGGLTPSEGLRFVAVHTDHHLKIVDEILQHVSGLSPGS